MLTSFSVARPKQASDVLKWEAHPDFSRETSTLLAGSGAVRRIAIGTVIGAILAGSAAVSAKAGGNTGNGALTMDATTPLLAGARAGVYTARCVAAAANGGTFRVEDPDGLVLGDVAVGAAFADDIKFVIADGSSDFVVGDGFDIAVNPTSEKVKELDLAAADGSQVAAGVSIVEAEAPSGVDVDAAVLAVPHGPAILSASGLVWPAGITAAQKAAAVAQLAARGILVRNF